MHNKLEKVKYQRNIYIYIKQTRAPKPPSLFHFSTSNLEKNETCPLPAHPWFSCLHLQSVRLTGMHHILYAVVGNKLEGFVLPRQTLYQMSYICSPKRPLPHWDRALLKQPQLASQFLSLTLLDYRLQRWALCLDNPHPYSHIKETSPYYVALAGLRSVK